MPSNRQSIDSVCETLLLLADQHRFHAVCCLRDEQTPLTLRELAERIALRKSSARREVSDGAIKRIYRSLHHNHVPKLRRADVVSYDPNRETVQLADGSERATAVVDAILAECGPR